MSQSTLLFADDIQKARREIAAAGGQVTQQFTENVFVANLPDTVEPQSLSASSPDQPTTLDPVSQLAVDAWKGLQEKEESIIAGAVSETEGLSWDTPGFSPPNFNVGDAESESLLFAPESEPQLSTGTPTSLYMTGSVAVGVVIVSGTQSGLGFSSAEQQKVIQEVQEGLDFLVNAEPLAKLSFVYDIHLITVSAAPGPTTSYEAAEGPWRNAALQSMGYAPERASSIEYVNNLRDEKGTNWAYVAYFTKYPLHHFAYAVTEKTVMHYDNDGWGVDSINRVFAHESCHIFGAADEYGSCSCGGSHGHLGIPNNNCRNCAGTQESCLMDANVLQLCEWSRGQIGWDESLFPGTFPPLSLGTYTIQQKSNNRFVDAHESSSNDFSVVTRSAQNNDSQRWILTPLGDNSYTLQHRINGRFLDAHESSANDFSVVTRTAQNNDTQRWILTPVGGVYTIQQKSNGRFMDAHESSANDFSVVTRTAQNNTSQQWVILALGGDTFTIQQLRNGRYVDAHGSSSNDFSVVTRTRQNNDTQRWIVKRA